MDFEDSDELADIYIYIYKEYIFKNKITKGPHFNI
jgi:hypothetical protein